MPAVRKVWESWIEDLSDTEFPAAGADFRMTLAVENLHT